MAVQTAPDILAGITGPTATLTYDEESQALCSQTDPEVFYPSQGDHADAAKAVCAECPIRMRCLEVAVANREMWGVWGGTSQQERRRMIAGKPPVAKKQSARIEVHGTVGGFRRHKRAGEAPCAECSEAHGSWIEKIQASASKGRAGRKPMPREHGTERGYGQHLRNDEIPCDGCKAAHAARAAQYRADRDGDAA
ncbi:WhiB family transcriptional regulator [Isoptericola sp. NPDC056134]|uniref:WhiB family transcriptional regulator n=1 Tax=Isoptericola sp. NPDC056134 TaxID=3345723 RepID=UPI0035E9BD10